MDISTYSPERPDANYHIAIALNTDANIADRILACETLTHDVFQASFTDDMVNKFLSCFETSSSRPLQQGLFNILYTHRCEHDSVVTIIKNREIFLIPTFLTHLRRFPIEYSDQFKGYLGDLPAITDIESLDEDMISKLLTSINSYVHYCLNISKAHALMLEQDFTVRDRMLNLAIFDGFDDDEWIDFLQVIESYFGQDLNVQKAIDRLRFNLNFMNDTRTTIEASQNLNQHFLTAIFGSSEEGFLSDIDRKQLAEHIKNNALTPSSYVCDLFTEKDTIFIDYDYDMKDGCNFYGKLMRDEYICATVDNVFIGPFPFKMDAHVFSSQSQFSTFLSKVQDQFNIAEEYIEGLTALWDVFSEYYSRFPNRLKVLYSKYNAFPKRMNELEREDYKMQLILPNSKSLILCAPYSMEVEYSKVGYIIDGCMRSSLPSILAENLSSDLIGSVHLFHQNSRLDGVNTSTDLAEFCQEFGISTCGFGLDDCILGEMPLDEDNLKILKKQAHDGAIFYINNDDFGSFHINKPLVIHHDSPNSHLIST
jgi:RNAse (barnase) inhibitor barstar